MLNLRHSLPPSIGSALGNFIAPLANPIVAATKWLGSASGIAGTSPPAVAAVLKTSTDRERADSRAGAPTIVSTTDKAAYTEDVPKTEPAATPVAAVAPVAMHPPPQTTGVPSAPTSEEAKQ